MSGTPRPGVARARPRTPRPAIDPNVARYEQLYGTQKAFLRYPAEWVIRMHAFRLRGRPPGRVLDYGFGSGNNARFFQDQGHEVFGVEVATAAFELLKKNGVDASQFTLVAPDAATLPYPDGHFDVVVANQSLYYLPSRPQVEAIVAEFHRVLRKGGMVGASFIGARNYYVAERGRRIGPNRYEVTSPARLGQEKELVWVPPLTTLRRLFAPFRDVEIGYYDQKLFGKGQNFHWLVSGARGARR
jgi:SAM-dependent methyltransferase